MKITDDTPTWPEALRFFLREYLPRHRGFSRHTLTSYATALKLLRDRMPAQEYPHELTVTEVLGFLESLETRRGNSRASRNIRLAALKSFWKAQLMLDPAHRREYERLLAVPFKRAAKHSPDYFDLEELARVFAVPDTQSRNGFRDHLILRYLYNTGSRISEVCELRTNWLNLGASPDIVIRGKGGKIRTVPLWPSTAELLKVYLRAERRDSRPGFEDFVFTTRLGTRFDRKSLWFLVMGYVRKAAAEMPSLKRKRLTVHSFRHTTAVHLLQAGVEINVIKAWLGHADVSTTSLYLDLDLEKKREALERFLKLDVDRLGGGIPDATSPLPRNVASWLERL